MRAGVIYPQTEFGSDPIAIRDYAQLAEDLHYTHLEAYDHVLGANPDRPGGWRGPYTYQTPFQEVFILFAFLSGVTQKLGFMSGILILPQRQTALVAKQAATLDVLSSGRFRLGVGLGWNEVEYVALGHDFHTRGRRIEEQIMVLRKLWTEPLVEFAGRWERIEDAGLNPMPIRRPIPIWFGARSEPAVRRAGRLGDGWIMNYGDPKDAQPVLSALDRGLAESGRTRDEFVIQARLPYGKGEPQVWEDLVRRWSEFGATQFSLNTMGAGLQTPAEHLDAIRRFADSMSLEGD